MLLSMILCVIVENIILSCVAVGDGISWACVAMVMVMAKQGDLLPIVCHRHSR